MVFGKFMPPFILIAVFHQPALATKKAYVVYMGAHSHGLEATSADLDQITTSHIQSLSSFLGSEEKARDALIHSYQRHINGFSAFLEEEEAAELARIARGSGVCVLESREEATHNTFMGVSDVGK
ncbi:hypothetical protein SASPL_121152 [Salvia splendens]|uniref:Inhibitor I9 domain-containing protein n=1 Tax=Salvia splendens TaxID=180675 RepID=A0A8X8XRW6_SALSN|nr:hypothetical protein SASPL_121152 [Salvia splendens]